MPDVLIVSKHAHVRSLSYFVYTLVRPTFYYETYWNFVESTYFTIKKLNFSKGWKIDLMKIGFQIIENQLFFV